MIYAICGTPGSYKSAYANEKFLLPALRQGRHVYTNMEGLEPTYIAVFFDLDPVEVSEHLHFLGRVYDDDGNYVEDPELVRRFYVDLPENALVIIDETQNYYNSRDFKEGYSNDLIPWLTKHRHLGNDVVWITQSLESVDITFRRNTALTYSLRRMEHLGLKNRSIIYIFDRANLDVRYLARKTYSPNPDIFKIYSSYQSKDVKETRTSYNVFLRSPMFVIFVLIIAYFLYTVFSGSFSRKVFHKDDRKNLVKKTEVQHENKPAENPVPVTESVVDSLCIVNSYKVHGQWNYRFSDGSTAGESFGRIPCK